MTHLVLVLLACLAWLAAASVPAAESELNVNVPAGKWKSVRLKELPRSTSVALQIEISGTARRRA